MMERLCFGGEGTGGYLSGTFSGGGNDSCGDAGLFTSESFKGEWGKALDFSRFSVTLG